MFLAEFFKQCLIIYTILEFFCCTLDLFTFTRKLTVYMNRSLRFRLLNVSEKCKTNTLSVNNTISTAASYPRLLLATLLVNLLWSVCTFIEYTGAGVIIYEPRCYCKRIHRVVGLIRSSGDLSRNVRKAHRDITRTYLLGKYTLARRAKGVAFIYRGLLFQIPSCHDTRSSTYSFLRRRRRCRKPEKFRSWRRMLRL